MKKILIIYGTRPEAIKLAPVIRVLKSNDNLFQTYVCSTAQHREMLDQVHEIFDIIPDYDLNIMKQGQDLFDITSKVLFGIKNLIGKIKPDMVLVHGDTTTAFATSLACFYENIKVGHIEAGLRTFNLKSPFPEEFNRQIISKIATLNFAPTILSKNNLIKDGINENTIFITGNTVIDSLFFTLNTIESNKRLKNNILAELSTKVKLDFINSKFILITAHRRENFGQGISNLIDALHELAFQYPNVQFVYPVHKNPNVFVPVNDRLNQIQNIHLIEPLDYLNFTILFSKCYFILTDSGGIQEEAPSLKKPVLIMRDTTERPEAIVSGTAKLIGIKKVDIVSNVKELLDNPISYNIMINNKNPFGDGKASLNILNTLINYFNLN
jgi:UDP-N-acetylglucosamine 2-epimerase (non-hydrolysing)